MDGHGDGQHPLWAGHRPNAPGVRSGHGGRSGCRAALPVHGRGDVPVVRGHGLLCGLERILRPLLGRLFPETARQPETMEKIAANVSANLLGLGNAATPLGIQAVRRMRQGEDDHATDEMCLLIVCNTASIQLIPTTVAAVRSGAGCATPFDILPAVWLASVLSVTAGICAAKVLRRVWR